MMNDFCFLKTYKIVKVILLSITGLMYGNVSSNAYTVKVVSGNGGYTTFERITIKDGSQEFTVREGEDFIIKATPDEGYRVASIRTHIEGFNATKYTYTDDMSASHTEGLYNLKGNATIDVEFEKIPSVKPTYSATVNSNNNCGYVEYEGTMVRNGSRTFYVREGEDFIIKATPDEGYRVASIRTHKEGFNATKYTYTDNKSISHTAGLYNLKENATIDVEFEENPNKLIEFTLSITCGSGGSVSCLGNTISGTERIITVNEGTSATLTFTPSNGYRIGSLKVNNMDVTSSVSNNKYTISSINRNTTVSVTFEAVPPTTYTLSITSSGSGSVSCCGYTISDGTKSFPVNEGGSATLTFTPNSGYRIGSLKINNVDVTSSINSNKYTINNINKDITIEVTFVDDTPVPDLSQYIHGYSTGGAIIQTNDLINSGSQLNWRFENKSDVSVTLKSLQLIDGKTGAEGNVMAVGVEVAGGSSVSYSTTIGVLGINVPVTCRFRYEYNGHEYYTDAVYKGNSGYTLTISSTGKGSVGYKGTTIREQTSSFDVSRLSSATISFTPDNGYKINTVKVNGTDVTSQLSNNQYTINMITQNTTIEVTFEKISPTSLTYDGVIYRVISNAEKTVNVTDGNYGQSLKVPANFYSNDVNWQVKGIDSDVITKHTKIAAVIWNPMVKFDATVNNPNFLLYVTKVDYAPSTIKNVIVNGTANSITLTEATSGNDFYCPEAFTARSISYTHNYMMTTGIGESQGWETIALPFDVQTITHSTKGEIIPFAKWNSGDSRRPFWLYELTSSGWREASAIKSYTPYIVSMPNNDRYYDEARLNGNVTFSATNVRVEPTSAKTANYQGKTFTPNFERRTVGGSEFALNVRNSWVQNIGSYAEGSQFVRNLRAIYPFEAYMSSENSTRSSFPIFEDMTTGIRGITDLIDMKRIGGIYNLKGQMVKVEAGGKLSAGIYIINGQKVIVK